MLPEAQVRTSPNVELSELPEYQRVRPSGDQDPPELGNWAGPAFSLGHVPPESVGGFDIEVPYWTVHRLDVKIDNLRPSGLQTGPIHC